MTAAGEPETVPARVGGRGAAVMASIAARQSVLIVLLFVAAFGLRLYHIDQPPLEFHAARQYRSLIIARGIFAQASGLLPDWQRQVAGVSMERQGILEPPVMETLAAAGYILVGSEQTWIPRLLSVIFWLIGGAFLYLIARTVGDRSVALIATAFYLFLPFAVVASRSFQPDPSMVALLLVSVWASIRYHRHPSTRGFLLAVACASVAFVWQPRSICVVAAAFVSLAIQRNGLRNWAWFRESATFLVPAAIAPAVIYGYGIISGAFRTDIAQDIFQPGLWFSSFLWRGWLFSIDAAVGLVPFFGGLLGAFLFARGLPRALLVGLWVGYFGFGLAFDFAVAVHDYYHLQLVPIVGLSAAPILAVTVSRARRLSPEPHWRAAIWLILAGALALTLVFARIRMENPGWEQEIATREAIGAAVAHSTRTIYLAGDYGVPLEYHGLLAGRAWPLQSDLEWEGLVGRPERTAEERYRQDFASDEPEYFVIEDFEELEGQSDLLMLLEAFPVLAEGDGYRIYDLRPAAGS